MAQAQTTGKSSSARGAAVLELKSASLSLLALVLKSADPAELAAGLAEKLGDSPGMFSNDPVVIDLSQLERAERAPAAADPDAQGQLALDAGAPHPLDLAAVVALLREHQMQPVAVQGATPEELEQAQALGLADASGQDLTRTRGAEPRTVVQEVEVVREVVREVAVPGEAARTLIIDKPLRSGQQVYAKGADLVVMALVSHGAEVIADGSIHVYAPLRGKAIAGARGNADARIFSLSMEAELISIAGIYRTTENPLPDTVLRKPAQIRLDGEKLVFEPF